MPSDPYAPEANSYGPPHVNEYGSSRCSSGMLGSSWSTSRIQSVRPRAPEPSSVIVAVPAVVATRSLA